MAEKDESKPHTGHADVGAFWAAHFPARHAFHTASLLRTLPWTGVVDWLRELDIDDRVIRLVEKERVPGCQIAGMTLAELIEDLGMSKLQAKRTLMHINARDLSQVSPLSSFTSADQVCHHGGGGGRTQIAIVICDDQVLYKLHEKGRAFEKSHKLKQLRTPRTQTEARHPQCSPFQFPLPTALFPRDTVEIPSRIGNKWVNSGVGAVGQDGEEKENLSQCSPMLLNVLEQKFQPREPSPPAPVNDSPKKAFLLRMSNTIDCPGSHRGSFSSRDCIASHGREDGLVAGNPKIDLRCLDLRKKLADRHREMLVQKGLMKRKEILQHACTEGGHRTTHDEQGGCTGASGYVSRRGEHTSAYDSIRQHTSGVVPGDVLEDEISIVESELQALEHALHAWQFLPLADVAQRCTHALKRTPERAEDLQASARLPPSIPSTPLPLNSLNRALIEPPERCTHTRTTERAEDLQTSDRLPQSTPLLLNSPLDNLNSALIEPPSEGWSISFSTRKQSDKAEGEGGVSRSGDERSNGTLSDRDTLSEREYSTELSQGNERLDGGGERDGGDFRRSDVEVENHRETEREWEREREMEREREIEILLIQKGRARVQRERERERERGGGGLVDERRGWDRYAQCAQEKTNSECSWRRSRSPATAASHTHTLPPGTSSGGWGVSIALPLPAPGQARRFTPCPSNYYTNIKRTPSSVSQSSSIASSAASWVGRYLPSVTQKYEKYEDSRGLFKDDSDSVICSSDHLCSSELAYSLQGDPPSEEAGMSWTRCAAATPRSHSGWQGRSWRWWSVGSSGEVFKGGVASSPPQSLSPPPTPTSASAAAAAEKSANVNFPAKTAARSSRMSKCLADLVSAASCVHIAEAT